MAVLSDHSLQRAMSSTGVPLKIEPIDDEELQIQPCSVDLRLGHTFKVFKEDDRPIDPKKPIHQEDMTTIVSSQDRPFLIRPIQFALAHTLETVEIPHHLLGIATGKSGIARLGLQVECAGLCDPGFRGQITLELFNMSPRPILLYPGMRICQLVLWDVRGKVDRPYGRKGSKYQGQVGPTESRIYQDF